MTPEYWGRAKRALVRRDAVLARIIRAHPRIALVRRGEPFKTLARSIVGQQISVKAAESVWQRVLAVAPAATPEQMHKARRRLPACGLSQRKAEYISDLARHFVDGSIHARDWPDMDDEAVIAELVQRARHRPLDGGDVSDVQPAAARRAALDDLGLQRAIGLHYLDGERATRERMRELGANWAPWRSVATWYLWRSLDPVPVEY